jgi:hypothetical protein
MSPLTVSVGSAMGGCGDATRKESPKEAGAAPEASCRCNRGGAEKSWRGLQPSCVARPGIAQPEEDVNMTRLLSHPAVHTIASAMAVIVPIVAVVIWMIAHAQVLE